MEYVQCFNCNKLIKIKELEKGIVANCKCGHSQKCISKNKYISKWRPVDKD